MQRFKEVAMLAVAFLCGWQIGLFACTAVNPSGSHGDCQAPKCQNYDKVCPQGWYVGASGITHRCCRTYTSSHRIYGDPPCCEWAQGSQVGCTPYQCIQMNPYRIVVHCERKYATRYGNWEQGDYYICEGQGDLRCSETAGHCRPL